MTTVGAMTMTTARAMTIVGAMTMTIAGAIETSYNKACPNLPFMLEGKE